ncbi:MAG: hypothetical protein CML06_21090 [Pseudomonadales bacterium]|nr:hypothetical protein [Pseudomonadales bacterium]
MKIARTLRKNGVPQGQIQAFGKNDDGLVRHKVKSDTTLDVDAYDVVHMGKEGAIAGFIIGFLAALAFIWWSPFDGRFGYWVGIPVWILFTLHGAWSGGLVGTHARNYRLKPFMKDLELGKYLLIVDVNEFQASAIRAVKRELDVRPDQASDTGVGALERWLPFSGSQTEWPDIRR